MVLVPGRGSSCDCGRVPPQRLFLPWQHCVRVITRAVRVTRQLPTIPENLANVIFSSNINGDSSYVVVEHFPYE
jgi:hypothetical protein